MQTFEEADLAKDGRISHEEWLILVQKHPVIINYMTLPVLREVRLPTLSSTQRIQLGTRKTCWTQCVLRVQIEWQREPGLIVHRGRACLIPCILHA